MSETLENILGILCQNVEKLRENEHQTVYQLHNAQDAKLAYDVVSACGLDVKFFPDNESSVAKLYIENNSIAAVEPALQSALTSADLLRKLKDVLDTSGGLEYELNFSQSLTGSRLTLQLPREKPFAKPAANHTTQPHAQPASTQPRPKARVKKSDEDTLLSGPSVARDVLPKSMRPKNAAEEDSMMKRMFLHVTGRAFTSGSFMVGILVILSVIFSLLVVIKGFLCPDFVSNQQKNPAFCPKPKSADQRALEQQ